MKFFRIFTRIGLLICVLLVSFSAIAELTSAGGFVSDEQPVAEQTGESEKDVPAKVPHTLIGDFVTLGLLILLQAVLGFDNLLYITLEAKNAPEDKRKMVRAWGIGLAIGFRLVLLVVLVNLQKLFETVSVFEFEWPVAEGHFNIHSLIVLAGGAFIIYTAMKEIWHMTLLEHGSHVDENRKQRSVGAAIFWIVVMNVVFSFDSILSAMALTEVFWVMATAIVLSGLAMIWLSDRVADFLAKNRMYEVLGLFVLFVVGIMLVSEGGHLAHLSLFGNAVEPMTKTTFYFVLTVLVLTDIVQGRYQKKLLSQKTDQKPAAA